MCNAAAVIGYRSVADATPDQVLADVEATISGLIREALGHPSGPLAVPGTEPDSSCAAGGANPRARPTHPKARARPTHPKAEVGVETWDAITARRNVRSFADRPIPAADLDRILEAGRRAPSSQNWQPW